MKHGVYDFSQWEPTSGHTARPTPPERGFLRDGILCVFFKTVNRFEESVPPYQCGTMKWVKQIKLRNRGIYTALISPHRDRPTDATTVSQIPLSL